MPLRLETVPPESAITSAASNSDGSEQASSQDNPSPRVVLEGEVDIGSAAELKRLLLEAAQSGRPAIIDLAAVTACDLAVVQLVCAATRGRSAATFLAPLPDAVQQILAEAGMDTILGGGAIDRAGVCSNP